MSESVELMQVVRTRLETRGNGRGEVLRVVTQYWSPDGELLAEVDPLFDIPAARRAADEAAAREATKIG